MACHLETFGQCAAPDPKVEHVTKEQRHLWISLLRSLAKRLASVESIHGRLALHVLQPSVSKMGKIGMTAFMTTGKARQAGVNVLQLSV